MSVVPSAFAAFWVLCATALGAQGRTAVEPAALPEDWQGTGGVAVVVTDETGAPLPEVNVVLRLESAAGNAGSLLLRTDELGRTEVSGLAHGEWQVELRREGYMLYSAFLRLDAKKDPKVGFASRQRTGTYWAPLNAVFLPRGLPVTTGLKTGRDTPKEARREARRIAKESRRETERLERGQRRGDLARVVEEQGAGPGVAEPAVAQAAPEAAPAVEPLRPEEPVAATPSALPAAPAPAPATEVAERPADEELPAPEAVAAPQIAESQLREQPDPTPPVEALPASPAAVAVAEESDAAPEVEQPGEELSEARAEERIAAVDRRRAEQEAKERSRAERRRRRGRQALVVEDETPEERPAAPASGASSATEEVDEAQDEEVVLNASRREEASPSAPDTPTPAEGAAAVVADDEEVVLVASSREEDAPGPSDATAAVADVAAADTNAPPAETVVTAPATVDLGAARDQSAPPARLLPNPRLLPAGACPECRPGEFAITTELELAPGDGAESCSRSLGDPLTDFAPRIHQLLTLDQRAYVGGLIEEDFNDLRRLLPESARPELERELAAAAPDGSACATLAIVVPEGARYIGFRYQLGEEGALGECLLGQECQVEDGEWLDAPSVTTTESVTLVHAVVVNRARRARSARLTVYFRPGEGWLPPN